MERRDFVKVSAGAAGLALTGCAPTLHQASPRPSPSSKLPPGYLDRYDSGLARIREWSPSTEAGKPSADVDRLARNGLTTMFVAGMLGDLPLEAQVDDGMQERVQASVATLDATGEEMMDFLRSRTDDDWRDLQTKLRVHGAGKQIIENLDAEAARSGVSERRRGQLRSMFTEIEFRLREQSPSIVVDEYIGKMEKVAATDPEQDAQYRRVASSIASEAFWQSTTPTLRHKRLVRAGKTIGWGVGIFAVSGLIVAAGGFAAVIGMTVGVITVLVGLIMLLVAAGTPDK